MQPRATDVRRESVVGSGAARSTPLNDKTDRKKPSAWRTGTRKTRRSVTAVSIAQSEHVFGAPGRPDGAGRHASVASAESHSVTSPRWTTACSYADQCPTRSFVVYCGWTFDLMSRSCTRSGHRGQRADSCLVAAEGLCTNAHQGSRAPSCFTLLFHSVVQLHGPGLGTITIVLWVAWSSLLTGLQIEWAFRGFNPHHRKVPPGGVSVSENSRPSCASLRQVPRIPTDVAIPSSPIGSKHTSARR